MNSITEKQYRLPEFSFSKKINRVLYSNSFPWVAMILTLLAHIFQMELGAYILCGMVGLYIIFFGKDYSPILPLVTYCYLMPGRLNNPGKHETSLFYMKNGAWILVVIAIVLCIGTCVRFALDPEIGFKKMLHTKRRLLSGMILLSAAYLLCGLGSEGYAEYAKSNFKFACLQVASLIACYFLFSFSVKWKELDRRYFAYVGLCMGLLVSLELIYLLATQPLIVDGKILHDDIYVGWGICNNMGLVIAMAIPFAFYFIYYGERTLLYHLLAIFLLMSAVLSTSRGAILGSFPIYIVCMIVVLWKGKRKLAKIISCLVALLALAFGIYAFLFIRKTSPDTLKSFFSDDPRMQLYDYGFRLFKESPWFGKGFYALNRSPFDTQLVEKVGGYTNVIPDRWHNTWIQLLAGCGFVGFFAYMYHRYQTLNLFLRKINPEKAFIGLSLLVLLLMSFVDCHFFNLGPVLFYSSALAVAEYGEN